MANVVIAEERIKNLLNGEVTIAGQANNVTKVSIDFGTPKIEPGTSVAFGDEDDLTSTNMVRMTVDIDRDRAKQNTEPTQLIRDIKTAMGKVDALKPYVRFEDDAKHALNLRDELRKFMDKGADLPPNLLEWVGFSDDTKRPGDYGVRIRKENGILLLHISVTDTKGVGKLGEKIRDNIKADLEEKKVMLASRLAKYMGIKKEDTAAIEAIKKRLDDLVFDVTTEEYGMQSKHPSSFIEIKIMTKEQKRLLDDPATREDKAKVEEAGKSSILYEFQNSEQLGKAIGRSMLFAGKHAQDMFPVVAGRLDMKAAIGKSLTRLAGTKPELAAEVKNFLEDDSFKSHENWDKKAEEKPQLKSQPFINIDLKTPHQVNIDFALPKGKANEVFAAIATADTIATLDQTPQQARDLSTVPTSELTPEELVIEAPRRSDLTEAQIASLPEGVRAQVMTAAAAQQQAPAPSNPDVLAQAAGGQVVAAQPGIDGAAAQAAAAAQQATVDSSVIGGFLQKLGIGGGPKSPMDQATRPEAPASSRGAA